MLRHCLAEVELEGDAAAGLHSFTSRLSRVARFTPFSILWANVFKVCRLDCLRLPLATAHGSTVYRKVIEGLSRYQLCHAQDNCQVFLSNLFLE